MSNNSVEETKISDKREYDCQTLTDRCQPKDDQRKFVEKGGYWQTIGQALVMNAQNTQNIEAAQNIVAEYPDLIPQDTKYIGEFDYQISEDEAPVKRFAILNDNLKVEYFIEQSKIQDIEQEVICRAVAYLRSNTNVRSCLVDILVRNKEKTLIRETHTKKPEIHTIVLYKLGNSNLGTDLIDSESKEYLNNRAGGFKISTASLQKFQTEEVPPSSSEEYFRLQDPVSEEFPFIFKQATFEEENIVLLFPSFPGHSFYRTAANMTDIRLYRDCIDVALKIANVLNAGGEDYDFYSNTIRGDAVYLLSQKIFHVGCKELQSSTEDTRSKTYNYFKGKWTVTAPAYLAIPAVPVQTEGVSKTTLNRELRRHRDEVAPPYQKLLINEWYGRLPPDPDQDIRINP